MSAKQFIVAIFYVAFLLPNEGFSQKMVEDHPKARAQKKALVATNDINQRLDILLEMGQIYSAVNLDSSIKYLERAYFISSQIENPEYHMKLCNTMGLVYENIDLPKSSEYYYEALGEIDKLENSESYLSTVLYNMGTMHRKSGDLRRALKVLNESLVLMEKYKDTTGIAQCYNAIGTVYMVDGKYDEGLEFWTKGLELKLILGEELSAAASLTNLAIYYKDTSQFSLALEYSNRAIEIFERYDIPDQLSINHKNIGDIYYRQEEFAKAIPSYQECIRICDSLGMEFAKIDALKQMSVCYYEIGRTKEGRRAHLEWAFYSALYESSEKERIAVEMATKYESDKIQQKNALLVKEKKLNEEVIEKNALQSNLLIISLGSVAIILFAFIYFYIRIRKANEKLRGQKLEIEEKNTVIQQSLGEKEVLLKEIHHRVKNNLEIISSLIDLQAKNIKDPDTLSTIKEWQTRLDSIALIHKNLYQSENFAAIQMNGYLDSLIENLGLIYKGDKEIELKLNINSLELNIEKAIPMGLIVNELVSNAYKYAFENKREGKIVVMLSRQSRTEIKLWISDDGNGLPADFNVEEGKSLGLKLVSLLSRQIKGKLSYYNSSGANFEIIINE